jgi:hypothetical protein
MESIIVFKKYSVESIPVLTGIQYIFPGKQTYSMESNLNFNEKDQTQ